MERITIGSSELNTSRIGLGTWAIGGWMWGGSDETQSIATIRAAIERGMTLIETARALEDLRREGKIRAIGVSNYSPGQMMRFRSIASLDAVQPPYNLFEREIEAGVLPYARRTGLTVLSYGALCRGLLSGRVTPEAKFERDDLRKVDPKFQGARFKEYLAAVEALKQLARERFGKSVLALAVRWVLDQGPTIALWGARRPEQVD